MVARNMPETWALKISAFYRERQNPAAHADKFAMHAFIFAIS
jgi:hypothetical protein